MAKKVPVDKPTKRGRPTAPGKGKPSRSGKALMVPLNAAQQAFIRWYMVRRNITRAYIAAYPNATYETARSEGSRLFRDPRISSQIKGLLAEEAKRLQNKAQKVSDGLAAMAFSSLADVLDDEGNVIPLTQLPRDIGQAVKKVKRREIIGVDLTSGEKKVMGHTIEVEMHDKVQPLRLLGLEVGMFTEKVELTGDEAWVAKLKAGRERALKGPVDVDKTTDGQA